MDSITVQIIGQACNQVLKCLAAILETKQTTINALPPTSHPTSAREFVYEGAKPTNSKTSDLGQLGGLEMSGVSELKAFHQRSPLQT